MAGTLRYLDKVVIITGGSKGIGKGIVQVFVKNGSKVVFCARGVEAGQSLEAEMNATGPGTCLFVPCDVSKEDDIKNLISVTVERFGRIDCLINNAGWHPRHCPIDEVTAEEFMDLLNLNLISYFLTTKLALPHLRRCQGNVIHVSSLVASIGKKYAVTYVTTKGAITAMTKAMAIDESRNQVRVNCLSPGNVLTPLWEELANQSENPAATIKAGEEAQLIGRMGTETECGLAALFLAADASFCTGVELLVSGGAELNLARKTQIS